jgi:hypothetical protein
LSPRAEAWPLLAAPESALFRPGDSLFTPPLITHITHQLFCSLGQASVSFH